MKKFDKKTEEDIEIAMPADLQEWCRQAKELQMLWADKENHDKKGSRFWKLNKVNEEAVQANLKSDFQRIAINQHEEVKKLLVKQQEYMEKIAQELLMVGEPIPASVTHREENILNILEDDKEEPVQSK